jgi:carboxylesterase type B
VQSPPKQNFDRRTSSQSPPQHQLERPPVSQTNSLNSDSAINVYHPRLSPDISFNDQLSVHEDMDSRPVMKKRVSFSEELVYIPDETPTEKKSFFDTLNQELSETKKKLVEERRVNTTPSREPFIPAAVKKTAETPQKISNKLLDMFQKKPTKEKTSSEPLVHVSSIFRVEN